MLIIDSFGKNIYVEETLVGYIDDNALFMHGKKFAEITDDGIISKEDNEEIGYVEDDGSIFINDVEVGYIDDQNNFVFYQRALQHLAK